MHGRSNNNLDDWFPLFWPASLRCYIRHRYPRKLSRRDRGWPTTRWIRLLTMRLEPPHTWRSVFYRNSIFLPKLNALTNHDRWCLGSKNQNMICLSQVRRTDCQAGLANWIKLFFLFIDPFERRWLIHSRTWTCMVSLKFYMWGESVAI